MSGRGFIQSRIEQTRDQEFPSIRTLYHDNCVSLDNFRLYIGLVENYKQFPNYFNENFSGNKGSAVYIR